MCVYGERERDKEEGVMGGVVRTRPTTEAIEREGAREREREREERERGGGGERERERER
jgi:hypothetical protein